jgi:hypothetical protein
MVIISKKQLVLLFLLITSFSNFLKADSIQPSPIKPNANYGSEIYWSRTVLLDSLFALQVRSSQNEENFRTAIQAEKAKFDEQSELLRSLQDANKKLYIELEESKGDTLQSSHTSSVLFVFNIVVAFILLIALIWMFSSRKKTERVVRGTVFNSSVSTESLEYRMDRIEKLGSLREKGLLTEEEFSMQKRQILAERN